MTKIPTLKFPALYHIGTLAPANRGEQGESLEGHLLSVSVCPSAWRSIARLGGRPLHLLEKSGDLELLDLIAVGQNAELKQEIEAWATLNGLLEQRTLWRSWSYDSEMGDDDPDAWRYGLHASQEEAEWEVEDEDAKGPNGPAVDSVQLLVGTAELAARVLHRDLSTTDSFDFAAVVWAEDTQTQLDGTYWNEIFAPECLSAPRGGIFPKKLPAIATRETSWKNAPVDDELVLVDETVDIEHGTAAVQETVTLRCGTEARLQGRLAYDEFYNEVIDHGPDDDGAGQKVLKLELSIAGTVVAAACAAYLNERRGSHLAVLNIQVDEAWRKRGIATIVYDAIERHYGDRVLPYPGNEGGAIRDFWLNRLKDEPELLAMYADNIGRPDRKPSGLSL